MININATTFLVIVNFVLLVYILKIILFDPLMNFLDERSKSIKESMDKAEESRLQANELIEEHKKTLQETRLEARHIIEKATLDAKKEGGNILKQARENAQRERETTRQEIRNETELIKKELRQEIASFSVQIAEKIIEKEIDARKHQAIIEKSLNELKRN